MKLPKVLESTARSHQYPLLFATVSGAHLYGFPSEDSDFDLRGVHILPVEEVVGLFESNETIEISEVIDGIELDLVTHDVKKFFKLLLKNNGYVLEQLFSPLIVSTSEEHKELKSIAPKCITRFHSKHYIGFAKKQWQLFEESNRVKPLLYVYRVLLTGIHLMNSGVIEANLVNLNQEFKLPFIDELISIKLEAEKIQLEVDKVEFHRKQFDLLMNSLEESSSKTKLPSEPSAKQALNELLKKIRLS